MQQFVLKRITNPGGIPSRTYWVNWARTTQIPRLSAPSPFLTQPQSSWYLLTLLMKQHTSARSTICSQTLTLADVEVATPLISYISARVASAPSCVCPLPGHTRRGVSKTRFTIVFFITCTLASSRKKSLPTSLNSYGTVERGYDLTIASLIGFCD